MKFKYLLSLSTVLKVKNVIFIRVVNIAALLSVLTILSSCSMVVSNSMDKFGKDFSAAVANHSDPDTVADGLPAYLLLMDSVASKKTAKSTLISSASRLYTAYASLFVENVERRQRLSSVALQYAELALCKEKDSYCDLRKLNFEQFTGTLDNYDIKHVELIYTLGQAWALWIQANSSDWNAIAQLAQVKWIMESVVEKNESVDQGGAYVILGVLNTLVPPAMGGKPEIARQYFEKALSLSSSRNLSVKVNMAEHYARLVFNQELHDRLLQEVLSADPYQDGFVLVNVMAQKKAKILLASSVDYF